MQVERRKYRRVTLPDPIRGTIGGAVVYVFDASQGGILIAHRNELPLGAFCRLEIQSPLGPLKLDCRIVRTGKDTTLYHSGLVIVAADRQSIERLRHLFA